MKCLNQKNEITSKSLQKEQMRTNLTEQLQHSATMPNLILALQITLPHLLLLNLWL